MVERDFGDDDDEKVAQHPPRSPTNKKQEDIIEKQKKALKEKGSSLPVSTLDERVQSLVSLICNLSMMRETLVEMEFDINKMPLGTF